MISFVMGMLSFTALVLFPILLHDLRGYPDSMIGMLLAARGIGNWLLVPDRRAVHALESAAGGGVRTGDAGRRRAGPWRSSTST